MDLVNLKPVSMDLKSVLYSRKPFFSRLSKFLDILAMKKKTSHYDSRLFTQITHQLKIKREMNTIGIMTRHKIDAFRIAWPAVNHVIVPNSYPKTKLQPLSTTMVSIHFHPFFIVDYYFPSSYITKEKSFPHYVDILQKLPIRSGHVHVLFAAQICSSGHVECSFDNLAKKIFLNVRKIFAQSPKKNTNHFEKKRTKTFRWIRSIQFRPKSENFSSEIWKSWWIF